MRGGPNAVGLRNEFYRDKFRAMATSLPILSGALVISLALNVALALRKPDQSYFAVDNSGRIVPLTALAEPYVTQQYLLNWVSETATRVYSFDALNYQSQLQALQPAFTDDGYAQFLASLKSAGLLDFVKDNLMIVSATPRGVPIITQQGDYQGTHIWQVQVPMLVTFRNNNKFAEKRLLIQMVVTRRQTLEAANGIGISQFIASEKH